PGLDVEPVGVFRVLLVFEHVLKGPELATDVIEDSVENHAETLLVRIVQELKKNAVTRGPYPRGRVLGIFFTSRTVSARRHVLLARRTISVRRRPDTAGLADAEIIVDVSII